MGIFNSIIMIYYGLKLAWNRAFTLDNNIMIDDNKKNLNYRKGFVK